MSLPPGFLDELRNRVSLSQVVGRKVTWDTRKSNQAKGDMWAPCPFHQEKTASFHVDDQKGFYYCFGCHAKGDAIGFVKETENVGFMEAVEILAREAGMPMPKRDPQAQAKMDRNSVLVEAMEAAVSHMRLQLKSGAGAAARDYLQKRGLRAEIIERFEIGFAPDNRRGLTEALTGKGVALDAVIEAGLAARPEDGGAPYDRFRGRIIFPIRDARGRCIALGGRAMDPNARAKYLNSPQTPLFDKSRSLYNQASARSAAGKGQPLIVTEGYMDVIALHQAGFEAAVAPLGTAVTDQQLGLLWRMATEPIIALDGDKAGQRAAFRVIDLALPLLQAGQSLRFALMPEGQDPDDLIKAKGAAAMQDLLNAAQPMVNLLWQRETEGQNYDSPERRAALDKRLRELVSRIQDENLRRHYGQALKDLRWQLFRPAGKNARNGKSPWRNPRSPALARAETKASALAAQTMDLGERIKELSILGVCVLCPEVIDAYRDQLDELELGDPAHRQFLAVLLRAPSMPDREALYDWLRAEMGPEALDHVLRSPHVQVMPVFRQPQDTELAKVSLTESMAKLTSERGLRLEIDEAAEDVQWADGDGQYLKHRLAEAAEIRNRAIRASEEDDMDFELGKNGAKMDREERDAFSKLLGTINFDKGKRS